MIYDLYSSRQVCEDIKKNILYYKSSYDEKAKPINLIDL